MWEGLVAHDGMLALVDQTRWSSSQRRELGAEGGVGSFVLDLRGGGRRCFHIFGLDSGFMLEKVR